MPEMSRLEFMQTMVLEILKLRPDAEGWGFSNRICSITDEIYKNVEKNGNGYTAKAPENKPADDVTS